MSNEKSDSWSCTVRRFVYSNALFALGVDTCAVEEAAALVMVSWLIDARGAAKSDARSVVVSFGSRWAADAVG